MPNRIVKQPVQVQRDGKLVTPLVGHKFEFTAEEVAEINKLQPKALGLIVETDSAPAPAAAPAFKGPEKKAATS